MKIEWDASRRYQGPFVEAAMVGKVEVGAVQYQPADKRLAIWICHLDIKPEWKSAYSVASAKAALEMHVTEWAKKAGLEQARVAA